MASKQIFRQCTLKSRSESMPVDMGIGKIRYKEIDEMTLICRKQIYDI